MEIEIGGTDAGLFDLIVVDGDLTFSGGEIRFEFLDGFMPEFGDVFDFLDVSGSIFGFETIDFTVGGLLDDFAFDLDLGIDGMRFAVLDPGPTPVPEPVPWFLMLLGFALLYAVRSRSTSYARD